MALIVCFDKLKIPLTNLTLPCFFYVVEYSPDIIKLFETYNGNEVHAVCND